MSKKLNKDQIVQMVCAIISNPTWLQKLEEEQARKNTHMDANDRASRIALEADHLLNKMLSQSGDRNARGACFRVGCEYMSIPDSDFCEKHQNH